jgi:ferric-dicitrate binding protein FerR (iron transport regulator)
MDKKVLIRYLAGDATREEKEAVALWLDASPVNMREFMALRKLHDITIWQNHSGEEKVESRSKRKLHIFTPRVLKEALKIAAVFLLGFLVFRVFHEQPLVPDPVNQTIYVPAGQRAEIVLADGSKVWLNANTTFTFPSVFQEGSREVTLQGEGYFDVAHDISKPFRVKTGYYDIRVSGTEFNVRAYPGRQDFEVSLISGSVEVTKPDAEKGVMLKPDEMIFMKDNRLFKSGITHSGYFLWKDGIISFDDETFHEIVRKLELYFDLRIDVKNDRALRYRYTGKFRSKDGVEHILKVLQLRQKFAYTIDDKLNIITIN